MESPTINNGIYAIKEVRKLFNELKSNYSHEEVKEIREKLYKKESFKKKKFNKYTKESVKKY